MNHTLEGLLETLVAKARAGATACPESHLEQDVDRARRAIVDLVSKLERERDYLRYLTPRAAAHWYLIQERGWAFSPGHGYVHERYGRQFFDQEEALVIEGTSYEALAASGEAIDVNERPGSVA